MNREITVTQDEYRKFEDSIGYLFSAKSALAGLGDYLDNSDCHVRKAALFEPIEDLINKTIKNLQEFTRI